jgi:integrase
VASLRYRARGWDLRYRDQAGRERTERFDGGTVKTPPEAALDRKAEVERELRRGIYVEREEREVTFATYYARWLSARRTSATRAHTDEIRARLHVLPQWGRWRLCDIRPSDVDDWVAALSKKMGPSSVRHCYTLLRGPIRRAVKDRIIADPLIDIALPAKTPIAKTFDDVLTAAEVARLVDAVADDDPKYAELKTNGRYRALILMGCWLGPRWNEAIGVRVCDVNPLKNEITFGRVVVNQNGSTTFTEVGSKTGDWRTVPVPAPVLTELTAHIATYCPQGSRDAFLFLTAVGTHPTRQTFRRFVLHKALRRAGLDGRGISWVSLRHTAASLMFDAGLTIFDVQRRLGHHSPVMTAEVYTHLMRERYEEGRTRMETYMARNSGR